MKKLRIEFDAIVSDETYERIKEFPCVLGYLAYFEAALNLNIERGERCKNLRIEEKP